MSRHNSLYNTKHGQANAVKRFIRYYFLLFAVVLLGASPVQAGQDAAIPGLHTLDPPEPAPALVFYGLYGDTLQFSDLRGKWRLVDFWATWCGPCLKEMPRILALRDMMKNRDFEVVFVSLDKVENAQDLQDRMKKARIHEGFESWFVQDDGVWESLGVQALPTAVLIDPQGRLRYRLVGETDWMANETLAFIGELIQN